MRRRGCVQGKAQMATRYAHTYLHSHTHMNANGSLLGDAHTPVKIFASKNIFIHKVTPQYVRTRTRAPTSCYYFHDSLKRAETSWKGWKGKRSEKGRKTNVKKLLLRFRFFPLLDALMTCREGSGGEEKETGKGRGGRREDGKKEGNWKRKSSRMAVLMQDGNKKRKHGRAEH